MCKKCTAVLKYVRELTGECKGNMEDAAKDTEHYQEVAQMTDADLPKHINELEPTRSLVAARLKKESMLQPHLMNQCMSNTEYDYSDYRAIGVNDGMLGVLASVLEIHGLDEEAESASAYIYIDE